MEQLDSMICTSLVIRLWYIAVEMSAAFSYFPSLKSSIASSLAASICRHVICYITAVSSQFLHPVPEARSAPIQACKDPISFEVPRLSFSFACHSSSHLNQAICFKNGESSNSLALGLFSWSISNVLLKNSLPSSLAFSGVVGLALEFPI